MFSFFIRRNDNLSRCEMRKFYFKQLNYLIMSSLKKRVFHLDLDFNQMCLLRNALLKYSSYLNEEYLFSDKEDSSSLLDLACKADDLYIIVMNVLGNRKL